jgi:hypothetical protein
LRGQDLPRLWLGVISMDFEEFPKIARLSRECVITEKIDGTNGQILIDAGSGTFKVGTRTRWIDAGCEHFGFFAWAMAHRDELIAALGDGRHFGEWWGMGVQRKYGLQERRFSLFNTSRWTDATKPACCHVVPVLYRGDFQTSAVDCCITNLRELGSKAAPGFMRPEGVIVYHVAANLYFKKTLEKDAEPKSQQRSGIATSV